MRSGSVPLSFIRANGGKLDAKSNLDLLDRCREQGIDPSDTDAVARLAKTGATVTSSEPPTGS